MTGILLAGGRSSRMGADKAFLKFRGRPLYKYSLDILEALCPEILISSSDQRFSGSGHRLVPDKIPGIGPLGGIYSCLSETRESRALILGCDMPGMNIDFIKVLIEQSKNHLLTVGKNQEDRVEPLAGIYHKELLEIMSNQIEKGIYKMSKLLESVHAKIIDPAESGFDPQILYRNINRPSDLEKST